MIMRGDAIHRLDLHRQPKHKEGLRLGSNRVIIGKRSGQQENRWKYSGKLLVDQGENSGGRVTD